MKVLIIGGGAREHSIAWKVSQSPKVSKIYCLPGNAGIEKIAECVDIKISNIEGIKSFVQYKEIDLVIVGPELPLSLGIIDQLNKLGIKTFGTNYMASKLESSKIFTKRILKKLNIPTADFILFGDPESAKQLVNFVNQPLVIKADGLASGKGVFVCETKDEAYDAIDKIMVQKVFGESGNAIIIEKQLKGEELSFMAFVDGKHVVPMPFTKDHKKLSCFQNINTGGMGAIGPIYIDHELEEKIINDIVIPLNKGLIEMGIEYKGVLYIGLMIDKNGNPKVLEINTRFGDPEGPVLMSLLNTDLIDIIEAINKQELDKVQVAWNDKKSICVVLASGGYPGSYESGIKIEGLDKEYPDINIFHSGTKLDENGNYVTNGGRVLSVVSTIDYSQTTRETVMNLREKIYNVIKKDIFFDGMYYREDIGIQNEN